MLTYFLMIVNSQYVFSGMSAGRDRKPDQPCGQNLIFVKALLLKQAGAWFSNDLTARLTMARRHLQRICHG